MKAAKSLTGCTLGETRARAEAERMAKDVLSNPVIEDYRVEIEG
jgi:phosphoribosylformylglycinamidine (FGAM) synthase PurS component